MNDNKSAGLTARQASAIAFVALLPPATRLLPGLAQSYPGARPGSVRWSPCRFLLSPPGSWGKLTTNAASDENLAGLILRGLGPYAGAAVLIIYALWMVFMLDSLFAAPLPGSYTRSIRARRPGLLSPLVLSWGS